MEDFEVHGRFRLPSLILEADPPQHTRARAVLSRVLSPGNLAQIKTAFVEKAEIMIDRLLKRKRFCGMKDLAQAYPMSVFPDVIGIQTEGRGRLLPHAEMLFNSFGPRNELFEESLANADFAWIDRQGLPENLESGGLGMMIHAEAKKEGMGVEEGAMLVRALLQAGLDTTINGIGATLLCLLRSPTQWALLKKNPALAKSAFEEAIRLESPVQTFFRTVTRDHLLGGVKISAGDKILMFLGAANRDPRHWVDPERYDITRKTIGHVGFGAGIHSCVGQLLSKLEAQAILTAFARRVSWISLTGKEVRRGNNTLRSLEGIPMEIE